MVSCVVLSEYVLVGGDSSRARGIELGGDLGGCEGSLQPAGTDVKLNSSLKQWATSYCPPKPSEGLESLQAESKGSS